MDLESQHYSRIGEVCKAGNLLELHFSDNCEEQMELNPGEIGVSMDALLAQLLTAGLDTYDFWTSATGIFILQLKYIIII